MSAKRGLGRGPEVKGRRRDPGYRGLGLRRLSERAAASQLADLVELKAIRRASSDVAFFV
jgi:hypothetical protein